jgi:malate dehydrogenase
LISIIGAGKVGAASAFNILRMRISDVTLIDVQEGLAQGEALDMIQASPAIEFDGRIKGSSNFADMAGSELVIVTAGFPRRPGATRLDLARRNAEIVSSIVHKIAEYAPNSKIMMITNPVDVLTYLAYKKSGFERNKVFGMSGILDALRYRSYIALELGVSREDVRGLVIGEHGDKMIPLVGYTSVSGIPIERLLSPQRIQQIVEKTRSSGMDVISLKGSTVHAPASVIAVLADAVLRGRNRVMGASVIPDGEYGLRDLAIGLPAVIGNNGIERIIELELDEATRKKLSDAATSIQSAISNGAQTS